MCNRTIWGPEISYKPLPGPGEALEAWRAGAPFQAPLLPNLRSGLDGRSSSVLGKSPSFLVNTRRMTTDLTHPPPWHASSQGRRRRPSRFSGRLAWPQTPSFLTSVQSSTPPFLPAAQLGLLAYAWNHQDVTASCGRLVDELRAPGSGLDGHQTTFKIFKMDEALGLEGTRLLLLIIIIVVSPGTRGCSLLLRRALAWLSLSRGHFVKQTKPDTNCLTKDSTHCHELSHRDYSPRLATRRQRNSDWRQPARQPTSEQRFPRRTLQIPGSIRSDFLSKLLAVPLKNATPAPLVGGQLHIATHVWVCQTIRYTTSQSFSACCLPEARVLAFRLSWRERCA